MIINWTQFTPYSALAGGLLIGLAATLFILCNGRIAGISGIVGGLLRPRGKEIPWREAFLAGLIVAPLAYQIFLPLPDSQIDAGNWGLIIAGLLVGFGSRLGAGCTSGHGVCGLARFSVRSLIATVIFMGTGFVTVYVLHHWL